MEEKDADETLRALRRVSAAGGKLNGSFYVACDSGGAEAGLIVTLAPRDPKGQKAARQGRSLRKALGATRFGHGTVRLDAGKLRFTLGSGNASVAIVKKAFRGAFSGKLAKLLRAARVASPDTGDAEDVSDERAVALSGETDSDIAGLIAAQEALAAQGALLAQSFLSVADEAEERAEVAAELLEQIAALESAGLGETERLRALRAELAASVAVGEELDLAPGAPLPVDMVFLMTDAADALADIGRAFPAAALRRARSRVQISWEAAQPAITDLTEALRQSGDPELLAIADGGLGAVLAPLSGLSGDGLAASDADRIAQHLLEHPAVGAIDDNPFGVPLRLREDLAPALRHLAEATRAWEAR